MKIPSEILDDRVAIVGTSGSGKTVTGKLGVEALLDDGARVCIVDALGVWWGLRSNAAGTGNGYPITIFGGNHGDLPLTDNAAEVIAEAIATGSFSCLVDLSELGSARKRRLFMQKFAEVLYAKNRDPLHLILDEADLWAPQKPLEDVAAILGARIDEIVRRGRARGFVPWLITQRPAVIHKDVLSQLDTLIAMKLTSSQDRSALGAWIEGQADKAEEKRILSSLPSLSVGEGFVWSPGHGMLKQIKFSMIKTFDSSRTPKRGERVKGPSHRASVDLDAIRAKLATVETEAAENDPKVLKARILELERQAEQDGQSAAEITDAYDRGFANGQINGGRDVVASIQAQVNRLDHAIEALSAPLDAIKHAIMMANTTPTIPEPKRDTLRPAPTEVRDPVPKYAPDYARGEKLPGRAPKGSDLPRGELATLKAVAQYPAGASREQLSVLTGYKRSSRDAYLHRLKEKGLIDTRISDGIQATADGIVALGDNYEPLPKGRKLQDYWLGRLPEGERAVLSLLISAYPKPADRERIDRETGYKRSSRDAYIQRLKTRKLVTTDSSGVRASDHLFG